MFNIHELDFHYHVGQERGTDKSVSDYLEHARMTGRRVLGITDHLGFYLAPRDRHRRDHYEPSVDGLLQYRQDVDEVKDDFPTLTLFFAPEIPPSMDLDTIPDAVLNASDFFICEISAMAGDTIDDNTELFLERAKQYAQFDRATSIPCFIAHPFRSAINFRLIRYERQMRDIEQWVTDLGVRDTFTDEEINTFFHLDIDALGRGIADLRIPMEINGGTMNRALSSNIPAVMNMIKCAYEKFIEHGVTFVPGSDQHGYGSGNRRMGRNVPVDMFQRLHIKSEDVTFARHLWAGDATSSQSTG